MKKIIILLLNVVILIACNVNPPKQQKFKVGELYYLIDETNHTAAVTYEMRNDTCNYKSLPKHVVVRDSIVVDSVSYAVVKIDQFSFLGCNAIESVEISQNVTDIEHQAFSKCANLKFIVISDSTTFIGNRAFYHCENLREFTVPQNVTKIEMWTCGYCYRLNKIEIHEDVTSIGNDAFTRCDSLQVVINHAKTPQEFDSVFFEVDLSKVTLKVPGESIDLYKEARGWKYFGKIVAI